MNVALHNEIKRKHSPSSASSYIVEAKKSEILEQLENAITKLKEARLEISKTVIEALTLKEAGDKIANQVVASVTQAFTINNDPLCA